MRDVMFYLEAQSKVNASPLKSEIQDGEVVIGASGTSDPSPTSTRANGLSSRGGRKKRGGR